MEDIKQYIEYTAKILEAVGVVIIALIAISRFLISQIRFNNNLYKVKARIRKSDLIGPRSFSCCRYNCNGSNRTNFKRVFTLAVIVLIRTFLSISLHLEIEGKFPWQSGKAELIPEVK